MALLNDAIDWLPGQLAQAKPVDGGVTLTRGSKSTASVPAVRAWGTNRLSVVDGLVTDLRPYDYLIGADAYLIDGAAVEPRVGDVITEPLGVFHVLPIADGPASVLREDNLYRIHTQRVDA